MKEQSLWKALRIYHDGHVKEVHTFPEIWEYFGWDIKHDEKQNEAAMEIARALMMNSHLDLSEMTAKGQSLVLDIVPIDSEEEA